MKIIYCHNREFVGGSGRTFQLGDKLYSEFGVVEINPRGGSTVAMESIPSWLLGTLSQGLSIVRKVGIARCSTDDNYNKKTGRELAAARLKTTTLTVVNIVKIENRVTVFFEDEAGNLFEVRKSADSKCARLVRMLDD